MQLMNVFHESCQLAEKIYKFKIEEKDYSSEPKRYTVSENI